MIVVDANIIVYHMVKGPFSHRAEALAVKEPDWRSPILWRYEFTNALRNMLRAGMLGEAEALRAVASARDAMSGREVDVPQEVALTTALRFDLSAYDAQYVALAELLEAPCVTADAPLTRKAPTRAILLADFLDSK